MELSQDDRLKLLVPLLVVASYVQMYDELEAQICYTNGSLDVPVL